MERPPLTKKRAKELVRGILSRYEDRKLTADLIELLHGIADPDDSDQERNWQEITKQQGWPA